MQLSYLLMVPAMAAICSNYWILLWSIVTVAFGKCASIFEEEDSLRSRFGPSWVEYHKQARAWVPRSRPFIGECATLHVAEGGFAGEYAPRFLEAIGVRGLRVLPHVSHTRRGSTRMVYQCGPIQVRGATAFGRALEHGPIGWALVGCLIRLGRVSQGVGPGKKEFHRRPSGPTQKPRPRTPQQRHWATPGKWRVHHGGWSRASMVGSFAVDAEPLRAKK